MSTLRTNALEGMDAKNSITIVAGAGNITTTNVQEGLAKVWIRASDAAVNADSLNVSSILDNTTGDYSYDFTSVMNNTDYCAMGTCKSTVPRIASVYNTFTTQFEIRYHNESGTDTDTENSNMVHGDLA